MSVAPEHFMPEPEHRPHEDQPARAEERVDPPPADDADPRESDENFWQWVALVVLLACWLAEASF
jgi:hypothetical protein